MKTLRIGKLTELGTEGPGLDREANPQDSREDQVAHNLQEVDDMQNRKTKEPLAKREEEIETRK